MAAAARFVLEASKSLLLESQTTESLTVIGLAPSLQKQITLAYIEGNLIVL